MPLVGDAERSRSGEILPCVGDMAMARDRSALSAISSEGGANFWESKIGKGERVLAGSVSPPDKDVFVEKRLLSMALPRVDPPRDPGEVERTLSGGGLLISGSIVASRDMPGSCLLFEMDPVSEALSS